MQRFILLLMICLVMASAALAQKTTITGRVFDSVGHRGLGYATLSLVKAKDSTLVTFSRADSTGKFRFNNVDAGHYLISTSYVGFLPVWKDIQLAKGEAQFDAGNVYMTDVKFAATDVSVQAKRPPVVINGDTLEFNSENFKTQPNAVVEDMLKKMPGVVVDPDGTVRVNGQKVNKVLVNGREFFTGDPKMATKNLAADAVDKVQVYDKKSDQSELTGIDDGNSQKTINLKLKKDRDNAIFGKATAGGGTDGRFDGQANINKFKGDKQASFLGMANNTNRQGFSISDVLNFSGELSRGMRSGGGIAIRMGGGSDNGGLPVTGLGQNQQGVARTLAGGLNYNNTFNHRKTDVNASYTANDVNLETSGESVIQNLLPGNNFNRYNTSHSIRQNSQQRFNGFIDQKIDSSFSVKITPALTLQETKSNSSNSFLTEVPGKSKLNEGSSTSSAHSNALNFTNNVLFRKKFAKKGRTISANLDMTYNHSTSDGSLNSKTTFYVPVTKDSILNQKNKRDATAKNFNGNLSYTEPLWKGALLQLSGYYSENIGESDKKTYDYNSISGKHDAFNNLLSNNFTSNYTYIGGSFNVRQNTTKFNYTVGAALQLANLRGDNHTFSSHVNQHFNDVLPNASFQYMIKSSKNVRLDYSTTTTQPSVTQLQPVVDISDPLNQQRGNPALKRQYNQSLSLNYFSASMETRRNFFAYLAFNYTSSPIVTSDSIKAGGIRFSQPVNAPSSYNVIGSVNTGFPVKALKSRVDLSSNIMINKNSSYLNGQLNDVRTITIGPRVNYNFSIDNKIDLLLTARYNYNKVQYTLDRNLDNDYWQQNYSADMTNYLPWGLIINNQLDYTVNTGRSDGFNTNVALWNASLSKGIMKNRRGEFKLSAFDILNRNVGVTRTQGQNSIVDQRYSVLKRYFLLSFTYSINKSGLNSGVGRNVMIRTM
ncbi:MAG: outer rane beta-barrel protein [Chitinophagaceae bacterium]|nr:outer rane beta-barrel protein [Chitinophagaceae bacterium]